MRPDSTAILGIWGGVLSTVLAAIRVHEYVRDRKAHVQVSFEPNVLMPAPGTGEITDYCEIRAVNIGKVPVTIAALAIQLSDKRTLNPVHIECYSRRDMPATLTQSQSLSAFLTRCDVPLGNVSWAFAKTTDGSIYKSKPFKVSH